MAANDTVGDPAGTTSPSGWGYLGNGSIFAVPQFGNTPWFPYAGLKDQMIDARNAYTQGAGGFTNQNTPMMQAIHASQPMVGGGLLGANAYTGAFNGGFNPFLGRGNPSGGAPTPPGGGAPPSGPPGGSQPLPPGTPGMPNPNVPPGTRPPRTPVPGGPPTQPPIGSGPPPTQVPGTTPGTRGGLLSGTQPLQPKMTTQPAGLLGAGPTMIDPRTGQTLTGGKNYADPARNYQSIEGMTIPGAPDGMNVNQFADYIMSLPESQRINAFNAFLQYKPEGTNGQWLGSYLDSAMRMRMGDAGFSQFAGQQGNQTVKSMEGVPQWLQNAITAPDQKQAAFQAALAAQFPIGGPGATPQQLQALAAQYGLGG